MRFSSICLLVVIVAAAAPAVVLAQAPPGQNYYPLASDPIDQLTARVALYPDALLSDVFVACTYPLEVVGASQWLAAGNNPAGIDSQDWDPSVKSVARYPDVLSRMASDVNWMNQIGAVFLNQQEQVMDSVQRLRDRAIAAGILFSTPQQQVIRDGGIIEIVPANPDVIYVPGYDPNAVLDYTPVPPGTVIQPLVTFDAGYPVGIWLHHDFDWDDHRVYYGDWGRDRPWWQWRDHDRYRYDSFRPGQYEARGEQHKPEVWEHDAHREMPRFAAPAPARPDRTPERGYGGAGREADRGVDPSRGFEASRDSSRGRASRHVETPQPAPARAEPRQAPVREAPPAREPQREVTREPTREPRQEPARQPVRAAPEPQRDHGAAVRDYGRGDETSRASARGGESRGAAHAASPAGGHAAGGSPAGGHR